MSGEEPGDGQSDAPAAARDEAMLSGQGLHFFYFFYFFYSITQKNMELITELGQPTV